jgi:hypothetical protein
MLCRVSHLAERQDIDTDALAMEEAFGPERDYLAIHDARADETIEAVTPGR